MTDYVIEFDNYVFLEISKIAQYNQVNFSANYSHNIIYLFGKTIQEVYQDFNNFNRNISPDKIIKYLESESMDWYTDKPYYSIEFKNGNFYEFHQTKFLYHITCGSLSWKFPNDDVYKKVTFNISETELLKLINQNKI